jgi:uracil-DNA glycosylase
MVKTGNDWDGLLQNEFSREYYLKLREFLKREYAQYTIFPAMNNIFNAFKFTSFAETRVVLLGQDPYHGAGQAHGLCFSVKCEKLPPSLQNIFRELQDDLGIQCVSGDLTNWAESGVLLLNTVLTVRENFANSHANQGWEIFTDNVIRLLNSKETPLVFILWGANARRKVELITNPVHLILQSAHPSPLSASKGFFGNRHFSKANEFLVSKGFPAVNWKT